MAGRSERGLTLKKRRYSDDETRELTVRAGLDLLSTTGLTVSVDHLRLEDIIQRAGVSRSAVYRIWPSKEHYAASLLLRVAELTTPSGVPFDEQTVRMVQRMASDNAALLATPEGRHELLVELCRVGAEQNFSMMRDAPEWRSYVALNATLMSISDPDLHDAMLCAMQSAEKGYADRMTAFYRQAAAMLGYKPRADIPDPFGMISTLGYSVIKGMALTDMVRPEAAETGFVGNPFGVSRNAEWTITAVGFTALVVGLFVPDEDALDAQGGLRARDGLDDLGWGI